MSERNKFSRTAIVIALSAIFPFAGAYAEDDVEALTNPNVAEAALKLPYTNKINPLYRQYNGVSHQGLNGNLDIDIIKRDENGSWFKLQAENLGLSTQEFGVSYEKQGDWAVGLEYNQIPRYSPYQVTTQVTGVESNTVSQNTPGATPSFETTLKTERYITTLLAQKYLSKELKLAFSFKSEEKTGARMNGIRGEASSATYPYQAFLFTPEPIDQKHNQFEATVDYVSAKLQLSAGYYGSFLNTQNNLLTINGATGAMPYQAIAGSGANRIWYAPINSIALSPDNSLNQIYVNGAYNFSESTRGNFKVAYSEGRQSDQFGYQPGTAAYPSVGIAGNPMIPAVNGGSLDGKVQTTEMFASLTSRITKDLKVLASWRYEDKQDTTPIRLYGFNSTYSVTGLSSPTATSATTSKYYSSFTTNNPESHVAHWGKLEADYRIGGGYSATAGVDYRKKSSDELARQDLQELVYRAALRKSMGETLNGTLTVAHSDRDGSEWRGLPLTEMIYPVYMADRSRDTVRGMLDWAAAENLNFQVAYEAYFDQYSRSTYGLDNGQGQVVSLDGNYALSDNWKLNAWYSKQFGESTQYQQGAVCTNAACTTTTPRGGALPQFNALLKANSDQFGFGLTGKIKMVDVGAQYLYFQDRNEQKINDLTPGFSPTPGMGILPDTKYTQSTFKLYGVYPLAKATKLRFDYIHDLRKMDDYTWRNWVFADGTRVFVDPKQTTQILGVTLIQSF